MFRNVIPSGQQADGQGASGKAQVVFAFQVYCWLLFTFSFSPLLSVRHVILVTERLYASLDLLSVSSSRATGRLGLGGQ